MKKLKLSFSIELFAECVRALFIVFGLTAVLLFIGRNVLGDAVIAMLFLLAVGWITTRSGEGPGLLAAVVSGLLFDFFFIPPFFTFTVGSLEGWLILIFFVLIAVILVNRIQSGRARALAREHDSLLLYELSMSLVGIHSPDDALRILAGRLQRLYQAEGVQLTVSSDPGGSARIAVAPIGWEAPRNPDLIIPLQTAHGFLGEINLWHGKVPFPESAEQLLLELSSSLVIALDRMAPGYPGNSNFR